jgi:hypothetical protein
MVLQKNKLKQPPDLDRREIADLRAGAIERLQRGEAGEQCDVADLRPRAIE